MLNYRCITPHFFKLVKLSCFGQHNMNNNIYIIDQYPLFTLPTLVLIGLFATFIFNLFLYKIANGLQLNGVGRFTYYKKICYSFRNFFKVEAYDFFTFFFLNGMDYGFKQLTVPRNPCYGRFFSFFQ